jgi:outer membrane murein-binding lipoprotein Lpp
MAISKPRNRVVLFRLTQEEYQQVQEACAEGGARSVSDFARARILGTAPGGSSLNQIQSQLAELSASVAKLTEAVAASQPRAEAAGAGYGSNAFAKPGV